MKHLAVIILWIGVVFFITVITLTIDKSLVSTCINWPICTVALYLTSKIYKK